MQIQSKTVRDYAAYCVKFSLVSAAVVGVAVAAGTVDDNSATAQPQQSQKN
jgi:hypothetical protein